MPLEEDVLKLVVNQLCWRVIIAFYLVADDVDLLVNLRLRILAVEDDVRQQVDSLAEMVTMDGGVERRVLFVGEGVQLAAKLLQGVDNLQGVTTLRSLEGDVFAEVRQSLLAS